MVRKREKQGVKPSTQMEVKRVNRRVARTRCSRDEGAHRVDQGRREEAAVDAGLSREEGKDKKEAEDLGRWPRPGLVEWTRHGTDEESDCACPGRRSGALLSQKGVTGKKF